MFKSNIWNKEQFIQAVQESYSKAQVLRKLGLKITGANYKTVEKYVKILQLSTAHWTGQGHLKGKSHNWNRSRPLSEVMVSNSPVVSLSGLKERILKARLLILRCYVCGIEPVWNGLPLTLQLDHINGDRWDNRLENLRLLCPNCHSQTHTFAGKNRKIPTITKESLARKLHTEKLNECSDCKARISIKSTRCKSCHAANLRSITKIVWPTAEEMKAIIWQKSTTTIAKELGVSDKAVEKFCKKYNIPKPKRGYWRSAPGQIRTDT